MANKYFSSFDLETELMERVRGMILDMIEKQRNEFEKSNGETIDEIAMDAIAIRARIQILRVVLKNLKDEDYI